jgi:hypothetical protein
MPLKWCGDNQIKNNPDPRMYDPDALNWVGTNEYLDACVKYNIDYSEEHRVIRNGKLTGEKVIAHIDGVITCVYH